MIAPANTVAVSCCCHHEAGSADAQPTFPGRGVASGLIRGLRGQVPFDGSQFPPFPWGGRAIPEVDIRFISDWVVF